MPYDAKKGNLLNTGLEIDHLFELASLAFSVEIALAVARKDSSTIQIKDRQELCHMLTNREAFVSMLEQGLDYVLSHKEIIDDSSRFDELRNDNRGKIVDYFMDITDGIELEELRFY